jgi:hypothetical protein
MQISMRTSMIVALITGLAIGCAGKSQEQGSQSPERDSQLDYCSCLLWGVTGPPPRPEDQPSPRPAACERILKRPSDEDCPIPT